MLFGLILVAANIIHIFLCVYERSFVQNSTQECFRKHVVVCKTSFQLKIFFFLSVMHFIHSSLHFIYDKFKEKRVSLIKTHLKQACFSVVLFIVKILLVICYSFGHLNCEIS